MDLVLTAASGLYLMLPALVPNSGAVLLGGGTPVDFGRSWRGRRILGDGKTWRGLFGGIAMGIGVGLLFLLGAQQTDPVNYWGFGPYPENVGIVCVLAVGSLLGDMTGAFIKRRMGLKRGQKAPVLDQYDFVAGACIFALVFFPQWFIAQFIAGESIVALITLLIFVPVLHRTINIIGYRLGKKKEPW